MSIDIRRITPDQLALYSAISIAYRVESVLRVEEMEGGLGGLRLVEERLAEPYVKDYDTYDDGSCGLSNIWPGQFDISRWGLFLAYDSDRPERPAGAATLAVDTEGIHMLEGRRDLAVLWDIRVAPEARGRGVGTALFEHSAAWARGQGCRQLKIETQNVNVPACRFYLARGCHLGAIHRYGYRGCPEVAGEVMLLWYLDV
jgi:GNAT superfamily N-acetyltransferase